MKEGYVVCDKCNGKGNIGQQGSIRLLCPKCFGYGELDWIEMAMGGKRTPGRYPCLFEVTNKTNLDCFIEDLGICIPKDSTINALNLFPLLTLNESEDLKSLIQQEKLSITYFEGTVVC